MNSIKVKSTILTGIQYSCLLIIFYMNSWFVGNKVLFTVQGFGIFLGLWAIYEMRKGKLNIAPHIREGAVLITSGPYSLVRHPMYLALLLALLPMLSENQRWENLLIFAIFLINLMAKLLFEESLLRKAFPGFTSYAQKTRKLIPLIY